MFVLGNQFLLIGGERYRLRRLVKSGLHWLLRSTTVHITFLSGEFMITGKTIPLHQQLFLDLGLLGRCYRFYTFLHY